VDHIAVEKKSIACYPNNFSRIIEAIKCKHKSTVYKLWQFVFHSLAFTCSLSLFSRVFSQGDNTENYRSDRQLVSLAQISPDGIWKLTITFWELKLVEVNSSTLFNSNFSMKDWTLFSVSATEQKKIKKHYCVFSTLKLSSVINCLPLHITNVLNQQMVLFFNWNCEFELHNKIVFGIEINHD